MKSGLSFQWLIINDSKLGLSACALLQAIEYV